MNRDESDTETMEKYYRVTLDFKMLVRPITPEVCRESFFFNNKGEGEDEANFNGPCTNIQVE